MPLVEAHVLKGYAPGEKSRLTTALTNAVRHVVPAPDEAITVLVQEYASENYARGGITRSPAPALPDPCQIVRDYLAAMEARDLSAARAMLAPGFQMVFPGAASMSTLEALIDWAKDRYKFVAKSIHSVEAFHNGDCQVVYVIGTLSGAWPDGTAFDGIRFVDRFEVKGSQLARQDVWNDIAEERPS